MILLNPREYTGKHLDPASRALMQKTIEFFESKGKTKLKLDDRDRVWYQDFLDFVQGERAFARMLTPAAYGGDDADVRWDTFRNCAFNEITAFYGLAYWYTWQVSILGLGPIWMSGNEEIKGRTAKLLEAGGIFAFGLSEQQHGADLYSSEMALAAGEDGSYTANGSKYYIGNANQAALVSTFGKLKESGDFVFFAADSQHESFALLENVVNSQSYVASFALKDYPIKEQDILSKGKDAWDAALNTVNVGKFNLGWASIGICTHAFYEAIDHASNRVLYGKHVTDFPHCKRLFVDAYSRLVAMKVFARRACDYMRAASAQDRRYLLYNPLVKMKVTTQGEEVIDLLWDVIAARGFERHNYFEMAARDIRALPKLEGTVHVNMALIIKFIRNYFFNPGTFPEIPRVHEARNDDFLFEQGPTKGLSKIQFHDFNTAYASVDLPNIRIFKQQIEVFKEFLFVSAADPDAVASQSRDIDFLLSMGEIFSLVAYGQLIIEYRNLEPDDISDPLLDQIFDFMVRDLSKFALQLYSKHNSSENQMALSLRMIQKPIVNQERFGQIFDEHVMALKGSYQMRD